MPLTYRLCLQCPDGAKLLAYRRGLCRRCYGRCLHRVDQGATTWADLEANGLALPAGHRSGVWPKPPRRQHGDPTP